MLDRGMVIPAGSKPRDVNKYSARTAARYLISKFCEHTDQTELTIARLENAIARSFYEALTGEKDIDLAGDIADFRPVPTRLHRRFTRGKKAS